MLSKNKQQAVKFCRISRSPDAHFEMTVGRWAHFEMTVYGFATLEYHSGVRCVISISLWQPACITVQMIESIYLHRAFRVRKVRFRLVLFSKPG